MQQHHHCCGAALVHASETIVRVAPPALRVNSLGRENVAPFCIQNGTVLTLVYYSLNLRQKPMASITLKNVPDQLLNSLRERADRDRRSLNQQAILLLEQALENDRPNFREAYEAFLQKYGPSPLEGDEFENLRSKETGRAGDL
jgi:plasmid stability protein